MKFQLFSPYLPANDSQLISEAKPKSSSSVQFGKRLAMMATLLLASMGAQVLDASVLSNDENEMSDRPPSESVNQVVKWNRILLTIVRTPGAQPATIHPTRNFAILHAAIYDAVNAITRSHEPYGALLLSVPPSASQSVAVAAAAHDVLVALYPKQQAALDLDLSESLIEIHEKEDRQLDGVRIGQAVAQSILSLRNNDRSSASPLPFVFNGMAGRYRSTPPNFPSQPVFTHWPQVLPFTLRGADQFRPGAPPRLASQIYSEDFSEIKAVGMANNTASTPDEALTGKFWGGPIQNYWNEIAQTATLQHRLSTAKSARLFALLNLTIADSVIAFYDAKYTYALWRPVTAIRAAGNDGNAETMADSNWLPQAGNTPTDPSYPGAHAVISAGSAAVLVSFFHRDRIDLVVTSEVLPNVVRSFSGFSSAAEEASLSRVFAGVHFRFDETAGDKLGQEIADFVVDHFLVPVHRKND